jgi:hypothetical protein
MGDPEMLLTRARQVVPNSDDVTLQMTIAEITAVSAEHAATSELIADQILRSPPLPAEVKGMEEPASVDTEMDMDYGDDEASYEPMDSPPVVKIDSDDVMSYEGVLKRRRGSICEVQVGSKVLKIDASKLRLLPPGSDLNTSLTEIQNGANIREVAKKRLFSNARSVPMTAVPRFKIDEHVSYLVGYLKKAATRELTMQAQERNGFISENVIVLPVEGLDENDRKKLAASLNEVESYWVPSRTQIRVNAFSPLCEQLDVAQGTEGNEAAKAFMDGMSVLQAAQKAMIDFQGISGKINSLVSIDGKGKKTAKTLLTMAKEVGEALKEWKDVIVNFSAAHDTFVAEFPEASPDSAETPNLSGEEVIPPEEDSADAAPPPEEAMPEESPAPPVETPPEAPAAAAAPPEPAPVATAESVANSLIESYDLREIFMRSHRSKLGRLVLIECRRKDADVDVNAVLDIIKKKLEL